VILANRKKISAAGVKRSGIEDGRREEKRSKKEEMELCPPGIAARKTSAVTWVISSSVVEVFVGVAFALDLRDAGVLSYERRWSMLYVHGRFAEWMTSKQYCGCDCAIWHIRETTMALAP
jgi:hypothetical protein